MKELFEQFLASQCQQIKASKVRDAMEYSLMGKGKRMRPMLLFSALESYDVDPKIGFCAGAALEMLHTYSLIHDDLPAMDNDDTRRGRPTCHKQFDEATAILAGDGLLTQAFNLAAISSQDSSQAIAIVKELANAGGCEGMILGQIKDLEAENCPALSLEQLKEIHQYKTGCLFSAPLVFAAILAGKEVDIPSWRKIGTMMGLAFQIQDDILDVTKSSAELGKSASDLDNNKTTYVSLLGLNQAQDAMMKCYRLTRNALKELRPQADSLLQILEEMEQRQY